MIKLKKINDKRKKNIKRKNREKTIKIYSVFHETIFSMTLLGFF
jgi:hypothetical protein